MADPMQALRGAKAIGPDPHPAPQPEDDWLGTAVQGLLGAVGLGNDQSRANRGGQLVGAALPFLGAAREAEPLAHWYGWGKTDVDETGSRMLDELGKRMATPGTMPYAPLKTAADEHPAVRALVDMVNQGPESKDPSRIFLGERHGAYYLQPQDRIHAPEGFEFAQPGGGNVPHSMVTRPDDLEERFAQQQRALKPVTQRGSRRVPAGAASKDVNVQSVQSLEDLGSIVPTSSDLPSTRVALSGKFRSAGTPKSTRLSEDDVRAIRKMYDEVSQTARFKKDALEQIGKRYGLKAPTVDDIVSHNAFNWVK